MTPKNAIYEIACKLADQSVSREERERLYKEMLSIVRGVKPQKPKGSCESFEQWWAVYPNKVARGGAEKAFEKAIKLATLDELIQGAKWYSENKPEYADWAHGATWLNQKRWLDKPTKPEAASIPQASDWPNWKVEIANLIGYPQTATWFKDAELKHKVIIVPTRAAFNWIKERYENNIQSSLDYTVVLK